MMMNLILKAKNETHVVNFPANEEAQAREWLDARPEWKGAALMEVGQLSEPENLMFYYPMPYEKEKVPQAYHNTPGVVHVTEEEMQDILRDKNLFE